MVLAHHWLVRRRGGERVLEALLRLHPDAPIYTLIYDKSTLSGDGGRIVGANVHESLLRLIPKSHVIYPYLLPLLPFAAVSMKMPNAEIAIYSDASLSKLIRADKNTVIICYCHSPMRYVWERDVSKTYVETLPKILQLAWPLLSSYLRFVDRCGSRKVDIWVANSREVSGRIKSAYGKSSAIVYPPVDVPQSISPRDDVGDFYLVVGYHVAYKRTDIAIDACEALGRKLIVVGVGPAISGISDSQWVKFVGYQTDDVVRQYYEKAKALLFPGEEDFGIVPVEAMAHGCPVIAYGSGGACESVVDGVTGVLFDEQSKEGLGAAILHFESTPQSTFDPAVLWSRASEFSEDRFAEAISKIVDDALQARRT